MRNRIKRMSKSTIVVTSLSFVLVAALLVGATLAFLTDITEARVNNFTLASPDLSARLVEPNWDGIIDYVYVAGVPHPVFGHNAAGAPIFGFSGDRTNVPANHVLVTTAGTPGLGQPPRVSATNDNNPANGGLHPYGNAAASLLYPGVTALKNPIIYNTGTTFDIWVAVRVSIVYSNTDANQTAGRAGLLVNDLDLPAVQDIISIDWNVGAGANEWAFIGASHADAITEGAFLNQQTLLFRSEIARTATLAGTPTAQQLFASYSANASAPVFTQIDLCDTATTAQMQALYDIGGFAIFVEGFAVQGAAADDFAGFNTWAGVAGNLAFHNSPTLAGNAVGFTDPHGIRPRVPATTAP